MKKILKASAVLLIIGSAIGMLSVQGVFQFEIGDEVAYEIVKAGHKITVSTTTDSFIGCSNGGTILENGTVMVVEVMNVTSTELIWNTTNLTPTITGTCPADVVDSPYFSFLTDAVNFVNTELDLSGIISSGIISPVYFTPFQVPLFVDTKPETWLIIESWEFNFEMTLASWFMAMTVNTLDISYSAVNDLMNLSSVYSATNNLDMNNYMTIESSAHILFNMTSGLLKEAYTEYSYYGQSAGIPFSTYSEYEIKQTEVPPDTFNFLNFLSENKWYFIGGGAGIVVIGATIGITAGVTKAKIKRQSSKKSSTKKKSTKKKR